MSISFIRPLCQVCFILDLFYLVLFLAFNSVSSKQQYEELTWNPKNHTITMVDVFSSLKNEFSFKVRAVPCWPGFVFRDNHCVCDKTQTGILRYSRVQIVIRG